MEPTGSVTRSVRRLRPDEAAHLEAMAADWARRAEGVPRMTGLTAGVFGALWVLTLLASDAPWLVVTIFWIVVGGVIVAWVRRDLRRELAGVDRAAGDVRAALERDEVEEIRVRATALVELEEVEDEGACWGFQVGERRMLFVCGQEFYATEEFPALDFALVHPLGPDGRPVDWWIEPFGPRVEPDVVVPASRKWDLDVPEHLEERDASPRTVEEDLGRAG